MKRIFILLALSLFAVSGVAYAGACGGSHGGSGGTPDVRYIVPRNDHDVDLTGCTSLTFEWHALPKPGGGRSAYRFELFEGAEDAYNRIYHAELARDVYSIDVPADMFKDGMVYTWRVKQRDDRTSVWSRAGDRWRFTVIKKANTK